MRFLAPVTTAFGDIVTLTQSTPLRAVGQQDARLSGVLRRRMPRLGHEFPLRMLPFFGPKQQPFGPVETEVEELLIGVARHGCELVGGNQSEHFFTFHFRFPSRSSADGIPRAPATASRGRSSTIARPWRSSPNRRFDRSWAGCQPF